MTEEKDYSVPLGVNSDLEHLKCVGKQIFFEDMDDIDKGRRDRLAYAGAAILAHNLPPYERMDQIVTVGGKLVVVSSIAQFEDSESAQRAYELIRQTL